MASRSPISNRRGVPVDAGRTRPAVKCGAADAFPPARGGVRGTTIPETGFRVGRFGLRWPNRQLAALFAYSLVNFSVGNGLLPLLPQYAEGLGASALWVGIYLGISYAAIALGTAVAGWFADRVGRRRTLMLVVSLAVTPVGLAESLVTSFALAVVGTAAIWFLAGMALALASILAGMGAAPSERGRVLGFLGVAAPVGSILGGLGIGYLADRLGFAGLWVAAGLLFLLCPGAAIFVRDATRLGAVAASTAPPSRDIWTAAFSILIVGSLVAAFGSFLASLGRSLAMEHVFTKAELTSTVAISGLVTLPFPFLIGFLSDRLGRLRFLGLCYAAGAAGLLVYSVAASLWQFWAASALVAFVSYVSTAVGSALVVDLVPRESVGRGMAFYSATGWAGGILGFAAGGYLFATLGLPVGFQVGAVLIGVAIALLPPIGWAVQAAHRTPVVESGASAPRKE